MIKFVFVFYFLASSIFAKDTTYGNVLVYSVDKVYDGDTITVTINGYPAIIGEKISVRIYGVDTPELHDKDKVIKAFALFVRDYVRELINKAKRIELRNIRRGKYFRIVAEVFLDGQSLTKLLLKNKFAKPYFGGHKQQWTRKDVILWK